MRILFSVVVILLITVVAGATYAYFSATGSHDFSNLVNLKTASDNAFGHLTSEDTVVLSAAIKDTITIGTGVFGSATIKY